MIAHPLANVIVLDPSDATLLPPGQRPALLTADGRLLFPRGDDWLPARAGPVDDQLSPRGVVLLSSRGAEDAPLVADLCARGFERRIPTALLRRADRHDPAWPDHPVAVVVDLSAADWQRLVRPAVLALRWGRARGGARRPPWSLRWLRGDARPAPFLRSALDALGDDVARLVVRPARGTTYSWAAFRALAHPASVIVLDVEGGDETEALAVVADGRRVRSTETHLLTPLDLPRDARAYSPELRLLDDLDQVTASIAELHLLHGDWELTRGLVERIASAAMIAVDPVEASDYGVVGADLLGALLADRVRSVLGCPTPEVSG